MTRFLAFFMLSGLAAVPALGQQLTITTTALPVGMVGVTYNAQLDATGGTGNRTWSQPLGNLPAGLSINAAGAISGTPIGVPLPSDIAPTFRVTDSATPTANVANRQIPITILPALQITTNALSNGQVGVAYTQPLTATGGAGTYEWSAPGLPSGLSISPTTGTISGTPAANGTTTGIVITVRDAANTQFTASRTYSLVVGGGSAPTITTASPLQAGTVGRPYSTTLAATGGTTPYNWTFPSGSNPPSLLSLTTVNNNGVLSGETTTAGTFNFFIRVTDSTTATSSKEFSMVVNAAPAISTASPLPNATQNSPYSTALAVTGGTAPFSWSVTLGSLPAGLNLGASTGTISGTPSGSGLSQFTVRVQDANGATAQQQFNLSVAAGFTITTATLPDWTRDVAYNQPLSVSGATGAVTWSLLQGTLPTGIVLNANSGVLTGTPTATGTFSFTIRAQDSTPSTASRQYTVVIAAPVQITTASLPGATVGTLYSAVLQASGGTGAVTWSLAQGSLPQGMTLTPSSGALGGTPSQAGAATVTFQAADSVGAVAIRQLQIAVSGSALSISTATVPNGAVNALYNTTLVATGGTGSGYVFALAAGSGPLPNGLQIAASGLISGTPTAAGSFPFVVEVRDSGNNTATRQFGITVSSTGLSVLTGSPLPQATVNVAYTTAFSASGGAGSGYQWTVTSGSLPPGLVLSSSGILSGSATAAGTFIFLVQASDSLGNTGSKQFTLAVVGGPLTIVTASPLADATLGLPYTVTLQATGGVPGAYSFTLSSGVLHAGLNLQPNGVLSGTPTTTGTLSFTIQVTDGQGGTATRPYTLTVAQPNLVITNTQLPLAPINVPYQGVQLLATGGTLPYQWSITVGTLPPGLTLNASSGAITGTPTAVGTYNFRAQVRDGSGLTTSAPLSINVVQFGITTTALADAALGVAYSGQLAATGGQQPYTWSISSGSLPPGLTLNATSGLISGTPSQSGNFNFSVQARDAAQATTAQALTLRVLSGLTIATPQLPGATLGVAYDQTLQATGGQAPYRWEVISGALPVGLTLSASSGNIRGTPATAIGSPYTFVIQVTDATGAFLSRPFTIAVGGGGSALAISTPAALPQAVTGGTYSQSLAATGGTTPYAWTLVSGLLPQGISLSTGGVLSGVTTQAGNFQFTIQVTDAAGQTASRAFTLAVATQQTTLAVTTSELPNGSVGTAYSQQLAASGGSGAGFTWALVANAGSLPTGLTLSAGGLISGTPAVAGSFQFVVRVTDSQSSTAIRTLTLTVAAISAALTITTTSLPDGVIGQVYNATLAASGGSGQGYTFERTAGQLPPGVTLAAGGVLSGTIPVTTTPQQATFTVRVRDSAGNTADRQFTVTIAGIVIPLQLDTVTLPAATINNPYSAPLTARGGVLPYTWAITGGLAPPGLTLAPATGLLAGTPTAPGTYLFTVQVRDAANSTTSRALAMLVSAGAVQIVTTALPVGTVGTNYSQGLLASGGSAPFNWTVTVGSLPPGLTLNPIGLVTGIPTVAGSYNLTIQVADAAGVVASRQFTLPIAAPLAITTVDLPGGTAGVPYSQTLGATGGTPPYLWQIPGGTLPTGLALQASTGQIAGTPAASGTSPVSVQVTDAAGITAQRQFTIVIGTSLSIVTTSLVNGATGVSYADTLTASGGAPPLQWSISAGSLPPGLTLAPATGAISGTPTAAGAYPFTARVQDSSGASQSRGFTLTVAEGLRIDTPMNLPGASEGQPYTHRLAASGGTGPYRWSIAIGILPPGISLEPSGTISGTPASVGNYSFIVQVTDALQQTAQRALMLPVSGQISIVTPAALPNATARSEYRETLIASGGVPPYTWSLAAGGTPPLGLTISPAGVLSGTPTAAGVFTFAAVVADANGSTAARTFTLAVLQNLTITTAAALSNGTAGVAYAQAMAAAGGQPPYTWAVLSGTVPPGLALSPGGILSGTPTANGSFTFTVQATDNARQTAAAAFSIQIGVPAAPSLNLLGLSETMEPAQQPRINVGLSGGYPLPLNGTLTLTFTPGAAVPVDDPAVVFTNGLRTADFTVPANATTAQLPAGFALQTGTVAGTIRLTATLRSAGQDVTPAPAPATETRIGRAAPVVVSSSVRARRVEGGLLVELSGFATSREITSATFRFSPAPGSSLQTSELTVPLNESAQAWYQGSESRRFGSQFTLTQRFNVQGDLTAIRSVTVTLTNAQGTSQPVTVDFQ